MVTESGARWCERPDVAVDASTLASLRRCRRILVLGPSGAGKTHLTRDLAAILRIEAIHLDDHRRPSDGEPCGDREWREIVKDLSARESWIMDGTYERSLDLRMPRADAVILLECPTELCLERVLRRERERPIPPRCEGGEASSDPIDPHHVRYISEYAWVTRPVVLDHLERYGRSKTVAVLPAPEAVGPFLSALHRIAS